MILKDLGEFKLIDRIARTIRLSSRVVKGIGDDSGVLEYKGNKFLLFTSDMLIEDVHFDRNSGGYRVGKKSLAVNINDILVMGGIPKFALVSLGLPPSLDVRYCDDLYRGIRYIAKKFNIDLVGGDTVKSKDIVINISLLGEVEKKNLILRSGAKEGDSIFVTGTIGGSLKGKHLNFLPRLKEARYLVENFKISSMIDVSDGLIADIGHILKRGKTGAVIYERTIPISKDAGDFTAAVRDGEDFELVWTMSKADGDKLQKSWPFTTRLSNIGVICKKKEGLSIVKIDGRKLKVKPKGFTHF